MKLRLVAIGALLMLVAVWGISYVLHAMAPGDWRRVPALVTIAGLAYGGQALYERGKSK